MRRRLGPRGISTAVDGLIQKVQPMTPLARVQRAWPAVVGEAVEAHATPLSLHSGTLVVACDAAVWAQEVELLQTELMTRLDGAIGVGTVTSMRVQTTNTRRPGGSRT